LTSQGISYGQFEKKTGWSHGLAGKVINKGVSFGVEKLERIFSAFPRLNPIWLITGEEEMLWNGATGGDTPSHHKNSPDSTSPRVEANDLKDLGFSEDEAKAFVKEITENLNPVHLFSSLERLLVFIEENKVLPDADKQRIVEPLHEFRNHLFLSANQAIASEAKYRAALDAIRLLAFQLKTEAQQPGKKK
jgi:hypothetical protein